MVFGGGGGLVNSSSSRLSNIFNLHFNRNTTVSPRPLAVTFGTLSPLTPDIFVNTLSFVYMYQL